MTEIQEKRWSPEVPPNWEFREAGGPRPFTTWWSYQLPDRSRYLWETRHQRKGAGPRRAELEQQRQGTAAVEAPRPNPWLRFWAPRRLAWWVAVVFMVGSAFFIAGAAGSLVPEAFGGEHAMSVFAEANYFVGALLYTVSIYGQILETINVDSRINQDRRTHPPQRFRWFAFQPTRLEFMTPFVLFIGSLVFNYETTVALGATLGAMPELWLWLTSLAGSLLFLVSSCMQLIEAGHGYLSFAPRDVSWWVAVFFILGSLGFILGSLPGFGGSEGFPDAEHGAGPAIVKLGFLGGGCAFLVGSYLMLPELFTQLRARGHRE